MNDFTKEELEIIQWEINTAINKLNMASLSCDKHSALIKKVESMIDSYCDHEWAFYISPHGNKVRCQKCNKGIPE